MSFQTPTWFILRDSANDSDIKTVDVKIFTEHFVFVISDVDLSEINALIVELSLSLLTCLCGSTWYVNDTFKMSD